MDQHLSNQNAWNPLVEGEQVSNRFRSDREPPTPLTGSAAAAPYELRQLSQILIKKR